MRGASPYARRVLLAALGLLLLALGSVAGAGAGVGVGAARAQAAAEATPLILWHSYRGAEEAALNALITRFQQENPQWQITALAIPYEAFASKLNTAIPHGNGPDVFIFAHERIGGWALTQTVAALDAEAVDMLPGFLPGTVAPLRFEGKLYGLPLAFKSLALFYNKAVLPTPPATTDALLAMAPALSGEGRFALAYQATGFYYHAPWYFGFGGTLLGPDGDVGLDSAGAIASFDFVGHLQASGFIPEEATGALISTLFNEGRAAMVINGPWFLAEIAEGVDFGVAPLPIVSSTGEAATPFLTDEAVMVSGQANNRPGAVALARFLAGDESAIYRATVGRQLVANVAAWEAPRVANDPVLQAFRAQLARTRAMSNLPAMKFVWEPGDLALSKVLRSGTDGATAAAAAMHRHRAISRPTPPSSAPHIYIILGAALLIGLLALLSRWILLTRRGPQWTEARAGWRWVAPAVLTTFILVVIPFVMGLILAFFAKDTDEWTFVGLSNMGDILVSDFYGVMEPLSFYYALLVTVLWTAVNIVLHVGIGLGLALLLNRKGLVLKPMYRVLLIVPWAVPNYITALLWKGMFHKQYGAINGMLEGLGLDSVSWFSEFGTAFFANVVTNAWLGFPFMMVVCLGALQSIPQDLYQAAEVDGANGWQRFRHVTLPLLKPALIPAILLGIVWTFNQFNIIYLVSGGDPDNSTDILITEAYRWAFERDRPGFAAAYAALIFLLLLGWSMISVKAARRVEAEQ